MPAQCEFYSAMDGEGGHVHPAFLVEQGDDHSRLPLDQPLRSAPVHKLALLNNKLELLS